MKRKTVFLTILSVFLYLTSFAHDLWLYVDNYYPAVGEKITVKVMFGHKFGEYDILLSKEQLSDFFYITPDGQKKEITKKWEEKKEERRGYLAGEIIIEQEGTYIICASRKVKGEKCEQPSEKYSKAIVTAGKGNNNVSQPLNNRIEIIPLGNPSEMNVKKELPVKILYEGNPLLTYVYATYEGFCSEDEPFKTTAKSDEKGIAYMKITQPGIWFITVNYKRDFSATLTFGNK